MPTCMSLAPAGDSRTDPGFARSRAFDPIVLRGLFQAKVLTPVLLERPPRGRAQARNLPRDAAGEPANVPSSREVLNGGQSHFRWTGQGWIPAPSNRIKGCIRATDFVGSVFIIVN